MAVTEVPQDARERFEDMYRAEAATVLLYASHRVGRSAAEDIVADTFAVAWRRIGDVPASPRAWLLATARKTIANHLRYIKRHPTDPLRKDFPLLEPDLANGISIRRELIDALAQLSPKNREVVIVATWYELSQKETAEVVGCSVTTAGVRLHRGRTALRKILSDADPALRLISPEVQS